MKIKNRFYFFSTLLLIVILFQMFFSEKMVQAAEIETQSADINDDDPKFELPESAKKFIPQNYEVLMGIQGDLNDDGNQDIAVVFSHESEKTEADDIDAIPTRILKILFSDGNDNYSEFISNDNVILCKWCGGVLGDPLWEMKIEDGVLNIYHYAGSAWRWGYNHNYKFIDGEIYLISESYSSYHNVSWCDKIDNFANFVENKYDYITGDFSEYEITECEVTKNVQGNKKPEKLIKLDDFKFTNE